MLGISASDLLSRRSRAYQARRDELDALSDDDLIQEMVKEPTLIRRPIVVSDAAHVVGSRKADLDAFAAAQKNEG
jgi:arsenate reductase-like glutaredoxin family protein